MSYTLGHMTHARPQAPSDDVVRILEHVRPHALRRPRAALAVLVGLPGSGKSRLAEALRARTGACVLESDALRALLFRRPTFDAEESRRLFEAIHQAIDELLGEGASVILDATNLAEEEREPLYDIAERRDARLLLVLTTAPDALIRLRLREREETGAGRSQANARVYERMRKRVEEIQRPFRLVDTSEEIGPAVAAIAKEMMGS